MRKTMVVALRDYQAAVKSKAFLVGLLMMPLMFGGGILFQIVFRNNNDIRDKRVAVVDYTGQLFDGINQASKMRNQTLIYDGEGAARKQIQPRYIIEKADPGTNDSTHIALALSDRVRKKELFAFVIIQPNALESGGNPAQSPIQYHSESPTYDQIQQWIAGPVNERIQQMRLQAAALDARTVREATRRVLVSNLGLVKADAAGNPIQAEQANLAANIFVPIGLMVLMFMVVMTSAALMNSVLEEKMQRIAEVLLSSIPPFQLMLGKLLGTVAVALTTGSVYLLGAYLALKRAGYVQYFPWDQVWWFVAFLSLAVLMFGSIFIAIGASVTDMKEAQSMMTPVMLLLVSPMFVWFNVVREPNSTLALVMSLIPPMTPMLMIVRQSVPPGVPIWQPISGIVLVLAATLICVFAASRIFRVGMLMQGKGAKVSEMVRWAIRG
ncbi:MAG: ABC transporter permease [Bryobacterales bacterium]|nr:ABC transporter permease [Bryobacterales bacterium]